MNKFIKENWFVVVIAIFFVGVSIFYAYDQHKDDLPGKKVGGKDVVFSIGDVDVTADEVYNDMYNQYGKGLLASAFSDGILDSAIETTAEIKQEAQAYTDYYAENYAYYGGITYLNQIAQQYYGYETFNKYMLYSIKSRNLSAQYIDEHASEYLTPEFIAKYNPRTVSYCLVKFEDAENPTIEETEKLKKVQDAWNSSEYNADNFAEFAKAFSDDSSTASGGGIYGYIDSQDTNTVEAFKEAAITLKSGEVSDWVFSKEYGYFLIKCDSTDFNDFKADASLVSRVLTEYENAANEIIWNYAQKANIKFTDEAVKEYILGQLGVNESED